MTHAITPPSNDASIAALAKETETSSDLVRAIYDEEVATLSQRAKIQQFVGVIATRIVRQKLRALAP